MRIKESFTKMKCRFLFEDEKINQFDYKVPRWEQIPINYNYV